MAKKAPSGRPFSSAQTEIKKLGSRTTPKGRSIIEQVAFADLDFMLRRELRPVRVMLELMKPDYVLHDEKIESTIVVFGSARILEPKIAKQKLAQAKRELKINPQDPQLIKAVQIAEQLVAKSRYYEEARRIGEIISQHCQREQKLQFVITTGGGPGIMEAANRGARDAGGKTIGLNIILPMEQDPNPYISEELSFQFHYFAMRKMHFLMRARALICFPGGYGTLDELFEVLTLLQTKKIKRTWPLLLFGKEYWTRLINFDMLVDEGMISPGDTSLFHFVETAEEAWQVIAKHYEIAY